MVVWETLVDVLPDGVLIVDARNDVRFANRSAAALLGYEAAELVGVPITTLLPSRLHHADRGSFGRSWLASEGEGTVVAPLLFRKGVEIEVEWSFAQAPLADGRVSTVALLRRRAEGLRPRNVEEESAAVRILRLVFEHAPVGVFHYDFLYIVLRVYCIINL